MTRKEHWVTNDFCRDNIKMLGRCGPNNGRVRVWCTLHETEFEVSPRKCLTWIKNPSAQNPCHLCEIIDLNSGGVTDFAMSLGLPDIFSEVRGHRVWRYHWERSENKRPRPKLMVDSMCINCESIVKLGKLKFKTMLDDSREVWSLCENHECQARRLHFSQYLASAKKRAYPFDLSYFAFVMMTSKICFYCSKPPQRTAFGVKRFTAEVNGLDRFFNDFGYNIDNVVPCCAICNRMKRDMSPEEFMEQVNRIKMGPYV